MSKDEMMNESVIDKTTSRPESPDLDKLLEIANKRKIEEHIPLITFFIITAFLGVTGNILTIRFYGFNVKRKTSSVLIALLGAFDLVVCFLCFTQVVELFVSILFMYKIICQIGYFLFNWFVRSSTFALWVIAIERYRHVCKPGKKQLTVKLAFGTVIGLSVLSMIYSTHTFLTYDSVRVNISTSDKNISYVSGHYCTNTKESALQIFVTAFHALDIFFFSALLISIFYTYGNILWTLREHNKRTAYLHNKPSVSFSQKSACSREVHTNDTDKHNEKAGQLTSDAVVYIDWDKESTETLTPFVTASCSSGAESQSAATNYSAKVQNSIKASQTSQAERNITIMMFVVIVCFLVCFIPYLIVSVNIRVASDTESELNAGIQFALRFPFLNSMINPIIFFAYNYEFRHYVKCMFTKCKP